MNIRDKARAKQQRRHPAKIINGEQVGIITSGGGISYLAWLKDAKDRGLGVQLHKGYATLHKRIKAA